MTDPWPERLRDLVARGLREHAPDELARLLEGEAGALRSGAVEAAAVEPLRAPVPVLGVDACPGGWVGVLVRPSGHTSVHASRDVAALVEQVREVEQVGVVAIDMPIGLPDSTRRSADVLARRQLPGRGSTLFTTLTRAAYAAPSYAEARLANLEATGGQGASAQAYALRDKLLQVDLWVRRRPGVEVIEVHPELCFARMSGSPLVARKSTSAGLAARRSALGAVGLRVPAFFGGSGFNEDDLLDACAAAWSATRHARGESESFPPAPEVFSDGLRAAIRV